MNILTKTLLGYSSKELTLLAMLANLSKHITPVGKTYKEADLHIEYGEDGEYIHIGNTCIYRFQTDTDKPVIDDQSKSFIKLVVEFGDFDSYTWNVKFILFLVDIRNGIIPTDYQPRICTKGFKSLLKYLYYNHVFDYFFEVISREAEPDLVDIGNIAELTTTAKYISSKNFTFFHKNNKLCGNNADY